MDGSTILHILNGAQPVSGTIFRRRYVCRSRFARFLLLFHRRSLTLLHMNRDCVKYLHQNDHALNAMLFKGIRIDAIDKLRYNQYCLFEHMHFVDVTI